MGNDGTANSHTTCQPKSDVILGVTVFLITKLDFSHSAVHFKVAYKTLFIPTFRILFGLVKHLKAFSGIFWGGRGIHIFYE